MFKVPSTYRPGTFSILSETLSCTSRIPTKKKKKKKGLKGCSTGKKTSQVLFSLASFLLMSSYSCKRMSRDQIQKQPTVRASLLVGTRRCHKLYTHAQNVARARTHTHGRTHVHTHKHTHTTTLFPIALCLPLSGTREAFKVPSTYHPGTFSILSETLSCTSRIPTNKRP